MWSNIATQTAGSFRGRGNFAGLCSRRSMVASFDAKNKVQRSSFSTLPMPGRDNHRAHHSIRADMIARHPLNNCACCWYDERQILRGHRRQHFSSIGEGPDSGVVRVDPPETSSSEEIKIPGAEKGGRKLAIIFTCTQCETRSAKQFTEHSYKHGVVIATCPGCQNKHLIADNLGFFSEDKTEGWNIETAMSKLGENVRVATNDDVLELSLEDIYTKEAIDKAVKNATNGSSEPRNTPNSGKDI